MDTDVSAAADRDELARLRARVAELERSDARRKQAEAALREQARQQAAAAEVGQRALAGAPLDALFAEAVALVARTLAVDLAALFELRPNGESLTVRAGHGWRAGAVGSMVGVGRDSQAGYTLATDDAVVVEDCRTERRFSTNALVLEHGVISAVTTVVHGRERPFGVLGVYTRERRRFRNDHAQFLRAVANTLATAVERTRAEDELAESEQRFRALVELAPDFIFSVALPDGTLTAANPAFETITGWPRADWIGRPIAPLVHPDDLAFTAESFAGLAEGRAVPPFEARVVGPDGNAVPLEARAAPRREDGRVVEAFGIARDMTDRQRVENELRRSRDELAIILRGVVDAITVQDPTGRIVYANVAAARAIGYATVEELQAARPGEMLERFEMLTADGRPFPPDELPGRKALRGAGAEAVIRFRARATQHERWSVVKATPVFDAHGVVQFAVNIVHDITERRLAEERERFLAGAGALLAGSLDWGETLDRLARLSVPLLADWCVINVLEDGVIRRSAFAHRDPAQEPLLRHLQQRYPPSPERDRGVAEVLRTGESSFMPEVTDEMTAATARDAEHLAVLRALGARSIMVVPLAAHGRVLGAMSLCLGNAGRRYSADDLALGQEVARRAALALDNARLYREAQAAIQRQEESLALLDTLLGAAPVGFSFWDPQLRYVRVNDAMAAINGHPRAAHIGRTVREMLPELADTLEPVFRAVVETGEPIIDMQVSGATAAAPGETRYWLSSYYPVRLPDGQLLGVGAVVVEITERQRGEDERARLLEAERSARAEAQQAARQREEFISIASHELKTPLTSIKASAQLLDRWLRRPELDAERVERMSGQLQGEIARLEHLVADLLDASRIQQGRLELRRTRYDLVELARAALERFEHAPERGAGHALALDAPQPVVGEWDPDRLDQVLTNLLSNALKYSPHGGEVRLRVARDGAEAVVTVTDHGIGIAEAELGNLFQPFARAAEVRQTVGGTGLGLFIAARIVAQHAGRIEARSAPGAGSTFIVRLPLTAPDGA